MKIFFTVFFIFLGFAFAFAQTIDEGLRRDLIERRDRDQKARLKCGGTADEQLKCLRETVAPLDLENTGRLVEINKIVGFPSVRIVGADGFEAFMLLLQHSDSDRLRQAYLKPIKRAFKRRELSPSEYSNYIDRLLLHQKKPQIYGTQFDVKDGKLVLSAVENIKDLDERRREIGLPSMAEYVKILREMYKLEIEIPKEFK